MLLKVSLSHIHTLNIPPHFSSPLTYHHTSSETSILYTYNILPCSVLLRERQTDKGQYEAWSQQKPKFLPNPSHKHSFWFHADWFGLHNLHFQLQPFSVSKLNSRNLKAILIKCMIKISCCDLKTKLIHGQLRIVVADEIKYFLLNFPTLFKISFSITFVISFYLIFSLSLSSLRSQEIYHFNSLSLIIFLFIWA